MPPPVFVTVQATVIPCPTAAAAGAVMPETVTSGAVRVRAEERVLLASLVSPCSLSASVTTWRKTGPGVAKGSVMDSVRV